MKTLNERRRWQAWALLLVFVPILMLSVTHIHEPMGEVVDCQDCRQHVHHSHVATAELCLSQCVLCQMHSLPFVVATAIALATPAMRHLSRRDIVVSPYKVAICDHRHCRAPPVF